MHYSQVRESKYLKQEDCKPPILVTISSIDKRNIARQGDPPQMKFLVFFEETEKPLVLNSVNAQIISSITGQEDMDDWIGHKIVLYVDPNVGYGGKITGGIRVRAPKNQPVPQKPIPNPMQKPASRPPVPMDEEVDDPDDDDMPF